MLKAFAALTLICYLAAALPMRYAADDFGDADGAHNITGAIHDFYFGWSGRYTYGLTKTIAKLPGERLVALPTLLILLGLWKAVSNKTLLIAALTCAPSLIQSLYWQAGATGYGLACLGTVALLLGAWQPVTMGLLAFVASGLSETGTVILPILCLAAYALEGERRYLWALAGAVLGLIVAMLSPGIPIRETYFQRGDLGTTIFYALRASGGFAAWAIRIAPLSVLAVALLPAVSMPPVRRNARKMLIAISTGLAVCLVASFTAYYATGGWLVPRAAILPIAVCMAALYLAVYWSGWRLNRPTLAKALTIIVLMSGLIQAVSIAKAWIDVPANLHVVDIGIVFP